MAIPWSGIKSAAVFFGPWLLPRIIAYYRRIKAEASRQQQQQQLLRGGGTQNLSGFIMATRPLTTRATILLALLAGAALAWLLSAGLLPSGATSFLPSLLAGGLSGTPENIFVTTKSRLQTPTDVLFTRLAAHRPGRVLTATDEALRARFTSLDTRLLYLQFGPDVLLGCLFCDGDSSSGSQSGALYLAYALVDLLAAHMANLVLVAIATSPLLMLGRRGKETARRQQQQQQQQQQLQDGSYTAAAAAYTAAAAAAADDYVYDVSNHYLRLWRTRASVAAVALAALDVYLVVAYDRRANARATTLAALDPFFWRMRTVRGIACAALLAALAALLRWALTTPVATQTSVAGLVLFGAPPKPPPSSAAGAGAGVAAVTAGRVATAVRCLGGVKSKLSAGAIVKNTALRDADLRARTHAYWAREVQLVAEAMEERDVLAGIRDALASHRLDLEQIARDAAVYAQNIVPPAQAPAQTAAAADAAPEPGSETPLDGDDNERTAEDGERTRAQPQVQPVGAADGARRRK